MAKILIVEDNEDLANTVRTFLMFEHHTVEHLVDGQEASDHLRTFQYELIILDWSLPNLSGLDILKRFRSLGGTTPVLMLTGHDTVSEKEAGLDSGADDYLTKPFHMKELGARVRALLRRPAAVNSNVLEAGNITIDTAKYRVTVNGEPMTLVPREFQLLEFFMRHPNQVFSPEALLNRVWPSDSEATTEALRTALKRLRKKVDPDGNLLRTVHGVGYILEVS
ncbi:MAG: response regulator transcription factor [Candidatus Obscuribacterales bacterium]|jgi:DNA-binding response OmpR family regulator|nr:response regulator transcription factor [Candidatus Obscuribacterales bacterium]